MVNSMLENLNEKQTLAVTTTEGAVLVLAGAGTGKTRVLTTRIAYILNSNLCAPWNILALTFTNRAANEMKNRIANMATGAWSARDVWCGTFHSVCLRILRSNAAYVGLRPDFLVADEESQKSVLKTVLGNMGLDVKDFNPGDWIERISSVKDKGLQAVADTTGRMAEIMSAYNAELHRLGLVDFADIILHVLDLFEKHLDVLARYQKQFKYILVDEFQDTNNAQMHLLNALCRGKDAPNICCVGDDDQSIYSWRGAEIKHILGFQKTFPGAEIIRLETNYRSTSNILNAANSLIRHNRGRLGKELRTDTNGTAGEPVYVLTVPSDLDEARIIADTIMRDGGHDLSKYAVLIRAGSLSRILEEEFSSRGIAYKLIGATKFYDRTEIRDAIAYLRLLVYPFDDMSFIRIIGKPRRGIGAVAINKIYAMGGTLMDGLRGVTLSAKVRAAADEFLNAFDFDWQSMNPSAAARKILDDAGYINMWRESKDVDAPERLNNIRELIDGVIAKHESLPEFLESAALMTADDDQNENPDNTNAVRIMTIHAAKGLEFDTVFLPAWEEGIFPNDKAIGEGALEEERRLGYVAITRARRRWIILNTMSRVVFGQRQYNSPSRFITEMDNKYLEFAGGMNTRPQYARPNVYHAPVSPKPVYKKTIAQKTMVGKLVSHAQLGRGVVIEDNGAILTIAFRGIGIKKVAREFIELYTGA